MINFSKRELDKIRTEQARKQLDNIIAQTQKANNLNQKLKSIYRLNNFADICNTVVRKNLRKKKELPKNVDSRDFAVDIVRIRRYLRRVGKFWINQAIEDQELILKVNNTPYDRYRYECRFILDNPIDLQYIKGYNVLCKRGMFSRQDNPFGCVKDHRLSVKWAYDNKIDPKIVGHLANLEFLSEAQNLDKSSSCSITLEQLLQEIKNWPLRAMSRSNTEISDPSLIVGL